jgi:hypothetical protein
MPPTPKILAEIVPWTMRLQAFGPSATVDI